jgi:hypothetical protein
VAVVSTVSTKHFFMAVYNAHARPAWNHGVLGDPANARCEPAAHT